MKFSAVLFLIAFFIVNPSAYGQSRTQGNTQKPIAAKAYKSVPLEEVPSDVVFEDALKIALQQFPTIQRSRFKRMSALEGITLAKTAYIPSLNIFSQTNGGNSNKLPGVLFPQVGALPIQGPTPEHPDYRMAFGTWNGSLLNWDIYDFGLRPAQVNKAKTEQNLAQAEERTTRFEVMSNVSKRFLEVIAAKERVQAENANAEREKVFLTVVQALVNSGLRPGVDEVRARTEYFKAQTQVIIATQHETISRYELSVAMGVAGQPLSIDTAPFTDNLDAFPSVLSSSPILVSHPLLARQEQNIAVIKARQQVLAHTYRPTISLQLGLNGRGSGFKPSGELKGGGYGLFPTRVQLAAALMVNYIPSDIFAAKSRGKMERWNEEEEKANYDLLLQELIGKLAKARTLVESAIQLAQYTPVQVQSAKATLTQSIARYQAGLSDIIDVADAQKLVYESEVQDKLAHLGVWASLLMAAEAQGDLTPYIQLVQAKRGY